MYLEALGKNLKQSRKKKYPRDDLNSFAIRIGVSRATYQRMEKGDLSVGAGKYYQAAEILGLEEGFSNLLKSEKSWFDQDE